MGREESLRCRGTRHTRNMKNRIERKRMWRRERGRGGGKNEREREKHRGRQRKRKREREGKKSFFLISTKEAQYKELHIQNNQ